MLRFAFKSKTATKSAACCSIHTAARSLKINGKKTKVEKKYLYQQYITKQGNAASQKNNETETSTLTKSLFPAAFMAAAVSPSPTTPTPIIYHSGPEPGTYAYELQHMTTMEGFLLRSINAAVMYSFGKLYFQTSRYPLSLEPSHVKFSYMTPKSAELRLERQEFFQEHGIPIFLLISWFSPSLYLKILGTSLLSVACAGSMAMGVASGVFFAPIIGVPLMVMHAGSLLSNLLFLDLQKKWFLLTLQVLVSSPLLFSYAFKVYKRMTKDIEKGGQESNPILFRKENIEVVRAHVTDISKGIVSSMYRFFRAVKDAISKGYIGMEKYKVTDGVTLINKVFFVVPKNSTTVTMQDIPAAQQVVDFLINKKMHELKSALPKFFESYGEADLQLELNGLAGYTHLYCENLVIDSPDDSEEHIHVNRVEGFMYLAATAPEPLSTSRKVVSRILVKFVASAPLARAAREVLPSDAFDVDRITEKEELQNYNILEGEYYTWKRESYGRVIEGSTRWVKQFCNIADEEWSTFDLRYVTVEPTSESEANNVSYVYQDMSMPFRQTALLKWSKPVFKKPCNLV